MATVSNSAILTYNLGIREIISSHITIRDTDRQITTPDATDDNIYNQYEYRGYHRFTPDQYFLTGEASPYSKTATDQGLIVARRHFQRLEMLIRTTGERVALWKRKWTGQECPHFDDRRGRSKMRCEICYGTGIVGGYELYRNVFATDGYITKPPEHGMINPPPPDSDRYNREYPYSSRTTEQYPTWQIFIRVQPETDDKTLLPRGMQQNAQPQAWALPMPMLQDRDIIIRYDEDGTEQWRYEILDVTRNEGFFKGSMSAPTNVTMYLQQFRLFRLDRTDIRYQLSVEEEGYGYNSTTTTSSTVEETIDQTAYSSGYNDAVGEFGFDPSRAGLTREQRRSYARGYSDGRNET